jgi:AcrR family transcriptional regulator
MERSGHCHEDPDRSRADLLDAAQRVFADKGFDAAGLRDITGAAGVAHGMIRHYFGTKLDLWKAVVDRTVEEYRSALVPYVAHDLAEPEYFLTTARAALRRFLEVSSTHPDVLRLILHEGVTSGERLSYALQQLETVGKTMDPLFRHAQAAGYLRQFDRPSFFLFLLTAGAMPFALSGLAESVLEGPLHPGSEQERKHINRILTTVYSTTGLDRRVARGSLTPGPSQNRI